MDLKLSSIGSSLPGQPLNAAYKGLGGGTVSWREGLRHSVQGYRYRYGMYIH